MIVEARDQTQSLSSDICIIGGGAAGITLAREFDSTKTNVILLESGNIEQDRRTQDLYRGRSRSIFIDEGWSKNYLHQSRLRFLGGTTNHWGGHCAALDELDFEERSWVPHSGWPLKRKELDPYYLRASKILRIDSGVLSTKYPGRSEVELGQKDIFKTKVFHATSPVVFGREYLSQLRKSQNIKVLLNANAVKLKTDRGKKEVSSVLVRNIFTRKSFVVHAKRFILAAGSIENARILLLNNLGNRNGLVGRFYSSHVFSNPSLAALSRGGRRIKFYRRSELPEKNSGPIYGQFTFTNEAQREKKLPNTMFNFVHTGDSGSTLSRVTRSLLSGTGIDSEMESLKLMIGFEQVPNPQSRVKLGRERDELGQRRVHLNWKLQDRDIQNIHRSTKIFSKVLGQFHEGRLYWLSKEPKEFWERMVKSGGHQMGTTRMADDPKKGVVDRSCKIHGMKNLYVAGSSVFPTVGCANPTFTIVALALRLADHLRGRDGQEN